MSSDMYQLNTLYEKEKDIDFLTKTNQTRNDNAYEQLLTIEEKRIKEDLNKKAYIESRREIRENDFYNLSIKDIGHNFIITWNNILSDLIASIHKYKENVYWWDTFKQMTKEITYILSREDRLIYVGMMMILLSIFIYFVFISSDK